MALGLFGKAPSPIVWTILTLFALDDLTLQCECRSQSTLYNHHRLARADLFVGLRSK
jgi:hypothetical protein